MSVLRVISWGHRRATDPLRAAATAFHSKHPDAEILVDVRPLSDFEHQGMAGVAQAYDLIVFDHPFCGDIARDGLFLPLEEHLPALLGPDAGGLYVGPSLESYRLGGHVWGAPIDAATQHALIRTDLLAAHGESEPRSWDDTLALGARLAPKGLRLGIAVETPHALANIASLMANGGHPWSTNTDGAFLIDASAFLVAYHKMQDLLGFCPSEALAWNSIDVHEAMVSRDDIVYCPMVYGYATYGEADQRRPLAFGPFAGAVAPFEAGSMIGGTAIGISSACAERRAALAFIAFMLDGDVQTRLIPGHHGQPAFLSAWRDAGNDARFNGFYSSCLSSMETAWTRPRRPGYPVFQRDAGRIVADALRAGADGREAIEAVVALASRL